MAIEKFLEVQCIRRRCVQVESVASKTYNWSPFNEGSYLDILSTDATTFTLQFTYPVIARPSPSGLEIWVVFEKTGGAGAGINWPGTFRFQTVGDKQPNPNNDSVTAWTGFVRPNNLSVYMTKIGEWVAGGV